MLLVNDSTIIHQLQKLQVSSICTTPCETCACLPRVAGTIMTVTSGATTVAHDQDRKCRMQAKKVSTRQSSQAAKHTSLGKHHLCFCCPQLAATWGCTKPQTKAPAATNMQNVTTQKQKISPPQTPKCEVGSCQTQPIIKHKDRRLVRPLYTHILDGGTDRTCGMPGSIVLSKESSFI
jgi:hypothetical protein